MIVQHLIPLGAKIRNQQINGVSIDDIHELKTVLAEYGVLVFKNQKCTNRDFVEFLKKFGQLTFTTGETPVDDAPDLNMVSNVGRVEKPVSRYHVDSSYFKTPPAYSALKAAVLPEHGGETLFLNQYKSFETLPDNLKTALYRKNLKHRVTRLEINDKTNHETEAHHPVFRKHPISGKIAIYMSTPQRCGDVNGINLDDSHKLVEDLYRHCIECQEPYRHRWEKNDIVMWDNGCTLHRADHSKVNGDRILYRGMSLGYNASLNA